MPWTTTELRSERLLLRCPTDTDRSVVLELASDPAVRRYLGGPVDAESAAAIEAATLGETWGVFVVVDLVGGRAVGTCGFGRERNELEISYMLLATAWGRGFGSEAVQLAIDWAWSTTKDESVIAVTQKANGPSLRLLEKIGFVAERQFVEHCEQQVQLRLDRPVPSAGPANRARSARSPGSVDRVGFVTGPDGRRAYDELRAEYQQTLAAPQDDMWAAFADEAEPVAITIGDRLAGRASIDGSGALQHFFVRGEFGPLADRCFESLIDRRSIEVVYVGSADPGLLSVALGHAALATPVALLYHHEAPPTDDAALALRQAVPADHEAVVTFMTEATDGPESWLHGYIAERLDRRELYLHEVDGLVAAAGERRLDSRAPGHAQLGIVVGPPHRGRGLGSRLMNALVESCRRDTLTPLCSTEPGNHAARKSIGRAGFRVRHRIFRLDLDRTDGNHTSI